MKKFTKYWLPAILVMALIAPTTAASDTAATYKSKCSACHGADGTADTPMGKKLKVRNLQSDEVQDLSDEQMAEIISNGKGKMPAFSKKLKSDEIKGLVSYIRSLSKD